MVIYEKLFLELGMNTPERFKSIRRHPISEFRFPKNAVWHHINPTTTPYEDPCFSKVEDGYIEPVVDFVALSEKAITKTVIKAREFKEILDAISIYPNVKLLKKSIAMIPSLDTVVIETYASFKERFIFKDTPQEKYLETLSYLASVVKRVSNTAEFSERQHFIPVYINQNEKPSKSIFNTVLKRGLNLTYMRTFREMDQCLMLELMRCALGEESIFSNMSARARSKTNFVFRGVKEESIMNLGLMLRMIIQDGDEDSNGTIRPIKAKNTLLRMNLVLGTEDPVPDHSDDDDDTEITALDHEDDLESDTDDDIVYADDLIHNDLSTLENIARKRQSEETIDIESAVEYDATPTPAIQRTISSAKSLLDKGVLSTSEYNRIANGNHGLDKIPSPDGKGTLEDYLNYSYADLKIKSPFKMVDRDTIIDKSMLDTTLMDFDSKYIKEFLHRDAIKFALSVQNADVIVKDVRVEEHEDIANHYHQFTMSIELVPGGQQTITFPLPVFDERGVTEVGGVNYYLKKQDGEMPIRKTKKNQVSLTSYYGKLFVERNDAVAYNYGNFLTKFIIRSGMDAGNTSIKDVKVGNVFYKHITLPRTYTSVAEKIVSFTVNNNYLHTQLHFDYLGRIERFGAENVARVEKAAGGVICGHTHYGDHRKHDKKDRYIVLGPDNIFRSHVDNVTTDIGSFEDVVGIMGKVPIEYVTVNIFGKPIPVVFLLGYKLGLGTLCKLLKVVPRKVKSGSRLDMTSNEYRIRFKNESWVFDKRDTIATLIFAGFVKYEKYTSLYSSSLYKDPEVFSLLLSDMGFGKRHYVEMKVIYDMFIDHITLELLTEMKEPTDMVNLFVRSVELLTTDEYPDEGDGRFMRVKGYERIAAAVYSEMTKSVRSMYFKNRSKRSRLDFNPMGVKMHLLTDSAKEVYDEINPVHALKQQEICTLSGHGGRNSDAITKNIKGFHDTDLGIKAEANVDSGNVGVITYLTANPVLESLRGTRGTIDINKVSPTSLVSTTALLGSALDQDDMKRVVFAGIQNSHVIPCDGYEVSPLVTGYEQVMGQRTDDLFAFTAEQSGRVTKLNSRIIEVTYNDGTKRICHLGTRHGKTKGEVIPHELTTNLKLNDAVVTGDTIVSNTNFFAEDPFLGLSAKTAKIARLAMVDDKDTNEDSVSMSIQFTGHMTSKHTVVRNVLVNFDKTIHNIANKGDMLESESKLMYIEDEVTSRSDIINERAADILSKLARNAPSARSGGIVDKIEIRYRGELDDMSPSLRDLAFELDRQLSRDRREANKKVITNRVDESYRVEGNPLEKNQAVIIFYITSNIPTGTGDKYILGNQMKATNSRVFKGEFSDSRRNPIDMTMAVRAYENRKVNSLKVIGFNIECIRLVQDKLIDLLEE